MRTLKLFTVAAAAFALAGCATDMDKPNVTSATTGISNAQIVQTASQATLRQDLQISAAQASKSLASLASIDKSANPEENVLPLTKVTSPELQQYIAVKWYGPVQPVLNDIAHHIGYHLQTYGKPPSLPVLVNIDTTANPEQAIQVIRNLDLQAGSKASVLIYTKQKVVSLRYNAS